MPAVAEYFLKVSIAISIVCILYQLLFKRLTFYSWNRYFLLIYSVFSFILPFIDISPALERGSLNDNVFVQIIPALQNTAPIGAKLNFAPADIVTIWTPWNIALAIIAAGIAVMLVRFIAQLLSLRKIVSNAKLMDAGSAKIYQLDKNIPPFSFGRSVFINRNMHDQADLDDIIRHETIHVKQRHTIDILWAELLCVINWYNPFAWWLKNSIKQNLEYIADNGVIENGASKKEYQYLLLKAVGNRYLPVASPFNFSSLKSRIAMMNKVKSARPHLLKFLFVVPMAAVILLSFRRGEHKIVNDGVYTVTGILFDEVTLQPISNAVVKDSASDVKAITDVKGFYKLAIPPVAGNDLLIRFRIVKENYPAFRSGLIQVRKEDKNNSLIVLLGMTTKKDMASGAGKGSGLYSYGSNKAKVQKISDYAYAAQQMNKLKESKAVDERIKDDPRPIHVINGLPNAFGNGTRYWFSKEDVEGFPEFKVWADGKIMTMEEANAKFNRFELKGVNALPRASAKELFGVDCNVLIIYKDSLPPIISRSK